jgi:hypothetical protein
VRRSLFEDSKLRRKLRRGSTIEVFKGGRGQTTSKGDKSQSHPAEVKFQWKNLGLFRRDYQGAMSGRNSLWKIHEITRTVGSREVTGWLEAGMFSTLGSRINAYY